MMGFGQAVAVLAVAFLLLIVSVVFLIWRGLRWSAGRYWRNHLARMAEVEAWIEAGPPASFLQKYATTEEYGWGREAMAQLGYRLEHEPFTDMYGYIVAEYVPMAHLMEEVRA